MRVLFSLTFVVLGACFASAQTRAPRSDLNRLSNPASQVSDERKKETAAFFDRVLKEIGEGRHSALKSDLHQTVHVSIPGVAPGQYSSNQASQLISTFLNGKTIERIERLRTETSVVSPYLSARVHTSFGERGDSLSLYISLIRSSGRWAIAHLSLY